MIEMLINLPLCPNMEPSSPSHRRENFIAIPTAIFSQFIRNYGGSPISHVYRRAIHPLAPYFERYGINYFIDPRKIP